MREDGVSVRSPESLPKTRDGRRARRPDPDTTHLGGSGCLSVRQTEGETPVARHEHGSRKTRVSSPSPGTAGGGSGCAPTQPGCPPTRQARWRDTEDAANGTHRTGPDYKQGRRTGLVETSRARRRCKSPDPPPKWARLEARGRADVEETADTRQRQMTAAPRRRLVRSRDRKTPDGDVRAWNMKDMKERDDENTSGSVDDCNAGTQTRARGPGR